MQSEFYTDLQKRMYPIALFGQLFSMLKTKGRTLESFGFERLDEQILLFFMVLRFIMERTLASETCLIEDISLCILEGNRELFHKQLDLEQCHRLADLMVSSILCNQGIPFSFNPIENDDRWKVRLNYLISEIIYQNGIPKASYKMSDDGFHLMLSTLEMEENMQLQFRDLVFELQMKAGNYPRALDEIRQIFQLLKIQEVEIQNKSLLAKTNAAMLDRKNYLELSQNTYKLMADSREKFQTYRKNVTKLTEELHHAIQSGAFSDQDSKNLTALNSISGYLSRSILAHARILEAINSFSALFDEQLRFQMRQSFYERRPFRQVIWKKIMDTPRSLENLDSLLHPLFFKAPPKQLSLIQAFQYQPLRVNLDDGSIEEINSDFDLEEYERQKQEKEDYVRRMNQKVEDALMKLVKAPDHFLPLDECFDLDQFESVDQARELLASLASLTTLDLEHLYGSRNEIILEEQTTFSLPLAILGAMESQLELQEYVNFQIQKQDRRIYCTIPDGELETVISLDGLLLHLERKLLV